MTTLSVNGTSGPKYPAVEVKIPAPSGPDGNVFHVIGLVSGALSRARVDAQEVRQFKSTAMQQDTYEGVLRLCSQWVSVS